MPKRRIWRTQRISRGDAESAEPTADDRLCVLCVPRDIQSLEDLNSGLAQRLQMLIRQLHAARAVLARLFAVQAGQQVGTSDEADPSASPEHRDTHVRPAVQLVRDRRGRMIVVEKKAETLKREAAPADEHRLGERLGAGYLQLDVMSSSDTPSAARATASSSSAGPSK